jgi:hypothetical protein
MLKEKAREDLAKIEGQVKDKSRNLAGVAGVPLSCRLQLDL